MSLISNISSYMPAACSAGQNTPQNAAGADFNALLASFDSGSTQTSQSNGTTSSLFGSVNILAFAESGNSSDFINTLIGHLQNASGSSDAAPSATAAPFSFTPEFQATFGNSGPLINWINVVTAGLGLSPQQNQALQNIAIEHKDTTGSQADIAQIASELTAAGIQA